MIGKHQLIRSSCFVLFAWLLLLQGCSSVPESRPGTLPFKRGINIGNALDAPKNEYWGVTIQKQYFSIIRDKGFDSVRLPVRFSDYTTGSGNKLDPTFMDKVDGYIKYGLKQKLYIILDLHHFLDLQTDPQKNMNKFLEIWDQLSVRYQNYPNKLVFEILNEPTEKMNGDTWNKYLASALKEIRKHNPKRWVIVDTDYQAGIKGLQNLKLPKDPYLAVSFHYYDPSTFTLQASPVLGYANYKDIAWNRTSQEQEYLTEQFSIVKKWSKQHHVPVFLGEFGANQKAPDDSRVRWTAAVREEAEKDGFSWSYWEFCSIFGIYDAHNHQWDEQMVQTLLPSS